MEKMLLFIEGSTDTFDVEKLKLEYFLLVLKMNEIMAPTKKSHDLVR